MRVRGSRRKGVKAQGGQRKAWRQGMEQRREKPRSRSNGEWAGKWPR